MTKNSIPQENIKFLLQKAQEIINISPDLSLKYALLAQERASSGEKQAYYGIFNKILGECYLLLNELKLAQEYISKAKDYYYQRSELLPKLEINSLMAKYFIKTGDIDRAVEIYHEMLLTSTTLKFSKGTVMALLEMATMYIQVREYRLAYDLLSSITDSDLADTSREMKLKVFNNKVLASIKCNITSGLKVLLKKSLNLAKEVADKAYLKTCYENYYLYYKLSNNIPLAFDFLEKTYDLNNELTLKNSQSEIAKILNQYEIDKKEQVISQIEDKRLALEEANKIIRKQKLFLETILDTIPNAIYYKDLSGNYLGYNKKWIDLFVGKSKRYNISNLYDVLPKKQADILTKDDEILLYQKRQTKNEYKIPLADKKEHSLVIYKDVFRDERGAIDGIIGVVNDVTEYKNTYLEASRNNSFLNAIFDYAPIGICIFADDGKIEKANNYLKEILLQYADADFENILDFVLDEDRDEIANSLAKSLLNNNTNTTELRLQAQNGMIIYAEISYSPVISPNTHKSMNLAIIKDITDRKIYNETLLRSERKLRDANYAKDRFFSIIAHDLRGPIGNYREVFKLLSTKREIFSEQEKANLMGELYKSADHTFTLLENLLQWTRSQKNELQIMPNYYSIFEIATNTINTLSALVESKKLTIENDVKLEHTGYFDINMISTVLRNLLSNAIKFSHRNSKILITSAIDNDLLSVTVKDFGVGIPAKKLERLFDPKEMSSTLGTAKEKGTGLGLVLCKNFVELNHGSIWVQSKENEGTSFTFTLPLENSLQENH